MEDNVGWPFREKKVSLSTEKDLILDLKNVNVKFKISIQKLPIALRQNLQTKPEKHSKQNYQRTLLLKKKQIESGISIKTLIQRLMLLQTIWIPLLIQRQLLLNKMTTQLL